MLTLYYCLIPNPVILPPSRGTKTTRTGLAVIYIQRFRQEDKDE